MQCGCSTHETTFGLVDLNLDLASPAFTRDFTCVETWYYPNVAKTTFDPVRDSHKSVIYMFKAALSVFKGYVSHIYIDRQAIQIFYKKIDGSSTMYCKAFLVGNEWEYPQ